MDAPPTPPDFSENAPGAFHADACSSAVDSACNVADFVRNYVRQRQHAIRCHCDAIHENAPIQGAAWRLALAELDHVAEACISVCRRTLSQTNA